VTFLLISTLILNSSVRQLFCAISIIPEVSKMTRNSLPRIITTAAALILLLGLAGCDLGSGRDQAYIMKILVDSSSVSPLAPLAWAVYTGSNPFFEIGTTTRVNGLEALAEDGDPSTVATSLAALSNVSSSGVVDTPDGAGSPGVAGPGQSYSFSFEIGLGERLAFATMYVQSNDLFYSPIPDGLARIYFRDTEDITDLIELYDAGTEINEEPGVGPNQAPRQAGPDTGPDENGTVRLISDVSDGFTYPADDEVITVTVSRQ
jgi:hypothetical protein